MKIITLLTLCAVLLGGCNQPKSNERVTDETKASGVQSRPTRPAEAILGQWRFIAPNGDYVADFYFRLGPADRVTLTVVRKDGEIFDQEYVLQNENFKTKYIELNRYYRKDRGETKNESGIARGLKPIRHQFSSDMMSVARDNFIMGEWMPGERLEFLSDRQSP